MYHSYMNMTIILFTVEFIMKINFVTGENAFFKLRKRLYGNALLSLIGTSNTYTNCLEMFGNILSKDVSRVLVW